VCILSFFVVVIDHRTESPVLNLLFLGMHVVVSTGGHYDWNYFLTQFCGNNKIHIVFIEPHIKVNDLVWLEKDELSLLW
jgi:hypothetical protein